MPKSYVSIPGWNSLPIPPWLFINGTNKKNHVVSGNPQNISNDEAKKLKINVCGYMLLLKH